MKQIRTNYISKCYLINQNRNYVLNSINLTINEGEFIIILGQSGSGKTTLLNILGLNDLDFEGDLFYDDKNVKDLSNKEISKIKSTDISFIHQFYNLIPNLNVLENVLLANVIKGEKDEERAIKILTKLGLKDHLNHFPNELSGGLKQRVAIARSLINNPKFIFADEPTGNLDSKNGENLMEIFKKFNEKKKITIVMVTHNNNYVKYASRLINILDGEINEI